MFYLTALENGEAAVIDEAETEEIEDTFFADEVEAVRGGVIAPEKPNAHRTSRLRRAFKARWTD